LRLYEEDRESKIVNAIEGDPGFLRTTCPYRFEENNAIYEWVGRTIIGTEQPLVLGGSAFLKLRQLKTLNTNPQMLAESTKS
jgi:hypothetical protein